MARNSFTLTGGDVFKKRLETARANLPRVMHEATVESLELLEKAAKEFLDREIYDKARGEFAEPLDKEKEGSLYASFVREVAAEGATVVRGLLLNTSPHAGFIEHGTDNEGTGSHFVPVVNAGALHWMNPATGESVFAKGGVMVKGIHPYRFMERALHENRAKIKAIYAKHAATLLRG